MNKTAKAKIALEDGKIFSGVSFGADGERCGEVVFNTSMNGDQEILTDPSYRGQIVTMTYPEIGNYGVNDEDTESEKLHLSGFIVRENSRIASKVPACCIGNFWQNSSHKRQRLKLGLRQKQKSQSMFS